MDFNQIYPDNIQIKMIKISKPLFIDNFKVKFINL
jgi:hypothetical protein